MNILKVLTPRRITGNTGEKLAVKFLKKNKYRILEKNFVANGHEIDIIAYKDKTVVFAEVKTRTVKADCDSHFGVPSSAVDRKKRSHLLDAARMYLKTLKKYKQPRMDVIEVWLDNDRNVVDINHIRNAYGSK